MSDYRVYDVFTDTPGGGNPLAVVFEADGLSDAPLASHEETAEFASRLVEKGVANVVVIGRGPDGSVMVTPDQRIHARCDVPAVRSRIGAGDSLMGAMVLAFSRGETATKALQFGVAAASAAVLTEATELCRRGDVDRLLPACVVTQL